MAKDARTLVWLDLEMTGLEPNSCAIVQLAIILTDVQLNPVAEPLEISIWQPESVLETMSPYVRNMHEKSGLLEQVRRSRTSVADAEKKALELVSSHCAYHTARLCGNSIGQDRRFLIEYMPTFERYLHYRQIDVSSLKELAEWWYGLKFRKPSEGQHTALHDVQQSIEELRYYRRHIMRQDPVDAPVIAPAKSE